MSNVEWPAEKIERRKVADLVPYALNAREHSNEQIAQIKASIESFGLTFAPLVDENNVLIAGHGRVLALQQMRVAECPVIVARGWTEDQKKAYRIADNQHGLNSTWNEDYLKREIFELKAHEFDFEAIGFDPEQVVQFIAPGGQQQQQTPDPYADSLVTFSFGDYKARVSKELYAHFTSAVERAKQAGNFSIDSVIKSWMPSTEPRVQSTIVSTVAPPKPAPTTEGF